MARHKKYKNKPSQKDRTEKRRTIRNNQSHRTSNVSTESSPQNMETEVYGANFPKPPPELIEGEEVYEVEQIMRHRRRGRGYQYYIKWKGYPISEALWEPEDVFSDDGDMLA
jgi:hypothetical protein